VQALDRPRRSISLRQIHHHHARESPIPYFFEQAASTDRQGKRQ
jgi:hypothetical protein